MLYLDAHNGLMHDVAWRTQWLNTPDGLTHNDA